MSYNGYVMVELHRPNIACHAMVVWWLSYADHISNIICTIVVLWQSGLSHPTRKDVVTRWLKTVTTKFIWHILNREIVRIIHVVFLFNLNYDCLINSLSPKVLYGNKIKILIICKL